MKLFRLNKINPTSVEFSRFTLTIFLSTLLFFIPSSIFAQGTPLSQQAQTLKRNIILTSERVLDQRSILAQAPGLQNQYSLESIKIYNEKKESLSFPSDKNLFTQFETQIDSLSSKDEKIFLTIFLERTIINLTPILYTEADYLTVKRHLNELNKLSRSSLKNCSSLYSLIGDTYSFIMQYEGIASFIKNGPKAQKAYEKAYDLDKQNYMALLGLATGDLFTPKIAGGDVNRAMTNFSLISRSSPYRNERYYSLFFLGLAFEKTKEREKAITIWEQANLIFPDLIAGKLLRVIEIGKDPEDFMK